MNEKNRPPQVGGRYVNPIQRQDAAFGLGALKRRPYNGAVPV